MEGSRKTVPKEGGRGHGPRIRLQTPRSSRNSKARNRQSNGGEGGGGGGEDEEGEDEEDDEEEEEGKT